MCSDWPWTCHQSSHCTSSTTTAWYQGLLTIQRDDIDEATSTMILHWARQFQLRQHRNWQHVLFSDESRFRLFRADGRTRIYLRAGEIPALCCVEETVSSGGGSVMVWGGICGQQRTDLIVIDGNRTTHCYLHMMNINAI